MFNFYSAVICLVLFNVLTDKSTSMPLNSNQDSKVFHINFNQNQNQNRGHVKLQRSIEKITYPEDSGKRENEFIDSYGNPIKSELHSKKDSDESSNPLLLNEKSDSNNHKFVIPGYASGIYNPNDTLKRSTDSQNVNDNIFFGEHHEGVPIEIPAPAVYITFPYNPDKPDTPVDSSKPTVEATFDSAFPNGPIVITEDVQFAEKPSDGLLPPKETSLVDVYYYSKDDKRDDGVKLNIKPSQTNLPPKTTADFGTFGSGNLQHNQQPQIDLDLKPPSNVNSQPTTQIPFKRFQQPTSQNEAGKYTGGFGGSGGVLGGQPSASENSNAIQPTNYNTIQNLPLSNDETNRYAGSFGGASGILGTNNVQNNLPHPANGANLFNNKDTPGRYSGNFGGPSGVLSPSGSDALNTAVSNKQPTTQIIAQLPVLNSELTAPRKPTIAADKYSGNFGGSPGVLLPNDNVAH